MTDIAASTPPAAAPPTVPAEVATASGASEEASVQGNATERLAERLFAASIATLETAAIHVGTKLGLYRALADRGMATPADLAARTGTDERYVREWLEQQAVAGLVTVDDPRAAPSERRYELPPAHRPVLVDEEDLSFFPPLAGLTIGVLQPLAELLDAYRSGAGVPYEAYGTDVVDGIAGMNGPQFVALMADWLAAMPEVHARLLASPPARVADVGCGTAWSSIALARAYPRITVEALDVDVASIEGARRNIAAAGLVDRVRAAVLDASGGGLGGPYDLVTVFEALHDMNHPVQALRTARESLTDGGCVVVADERVAERFTVPGDDIERLNYGFSVLHCLAVGNLDPDSAATGTVIRPDTVRAYATEAGFGSVEVLPIEHDFWRFYRLLP